MHVSYGGKFYEIIPRILLTKVLLRSNRRLSVKLLSVALVDKAASMPGFQPASSSTKCQGLVTTPEVLAILSSVTWSKT